MKLTDWMSKARGRSLLLAKALGVSQASTSDWSTGKKGVPAERCVPIEQATEGAVTRRDLRPADWGDIWPELIDKLHPWPPHGDVIKPDSAVPLNATHLGQAFVEVNLGPLPPHAASECSGAPAPEAA
jgi:DNA-binding transcriptional regulator YdaS (Cro superfamily)